MFSDVNSFYCEIHHSILNHVSSIFFSVPFLGGGVQLNGSGYLAYVDVSLWHAIHMISVIYCKGSDKNE